MDGAVLLASGRDADVLALDDRRVLRRYRAGGDVAAEAAVMAHLAGLGFPVPVVHEACGPDLVLERLDGCTLLSALLAGQVHAEAAAGCLADLHVRLHALPPRLRAVEDCRVLHLDLHPDNVMLTSRGPVLIDWRNADEGPADLDVAMTAVILAQVAVDEEHLLASVAATVLAAFLHCVGEGLLTELDPAVARRRSDPALTSRERERLDDAAALIVSARQRSPTAGSVGGDRPRSRLDA